MDKPKYQYPILVKARLLPNGKGKKIDNEFIFEIYHVDEREEIENRERFKKIREYDKGRMDGDRSAYFTNFIYKDSKPQSWYLKMFLPAQESNVVSKSTFVAKGKNIVIWNEYWTLEIMKFQAGKGWRCFNFDTIVNNPYIEKNLLPFIGIWRGRPDAFFQFPLLPKCSIVTYRKICGTEGRVKIVSEGFDKVFELGQLAGKRTRPIDYIPPQTRGKKITIDKLFLVPSPSDDESQENTINNNNKRSINDDEEDDDEEYDSSSESYDSDDRLSMEKKSKLQTKRISNNSDSMINPKKKLLKQNGKDEIINQDKEFDEEDIDDENDTDGKGFRMTMEGNFDRALTIFEKDKKDRKEKSNQKTKSKKNKLPIDFASLDELLVDYGNNPKHFLDRWYEVSYNRMRNEEIGWLSMNERFIWIRKDAIKNQLSQENAPSKFYIIWNLYGHTFTSFEEQIKNIVRINRMKKYTKVISNQQNQHNQIEEIQDTTIEKTNSQSIIPQIVESITNLPIEKETLQIENVTIEKEIIHEETIENITMEKEIVDEETIEKEILDEEKIEKETIEKETIENAMIEKKTIEKETVDEETIEKETIEDDEFISSSGRVVSNFDVDCNFEENYIVDFDYIDKNGEERSEERRINYTIELNGTVPFQWFFTIDLVSRIFGGPRNNYIKWFTKIESYGQDYDLWNSWMHWKDWKDRMINNPKKLKELKFVGVKDLIRKRNIKFEEIATWEDLLPSSKILPKENKRNENIPLEDLFSREKMAELYDSEFENLYHTTFTFLCNTARTFLELCQGKIECDTLHFWIKWKLYLAKTLKRIIVFHPTFIMFTNIICSLWESDNFPNNRGCWNTFTSDIKQIDSSVEKDTGITNLGNTYTLLLGTDQFHFLLKSADKHKQLFKASEFYEEQFIESQFPTPK